MTNPTKGYYKKTVVPPLQWDRPQTCTKHSTHTQGDAQGKRQKANCVKLIVLQTLLSHWLRLNIDAKVSPTMLPAMSATPVNGASRNKACRCGHHRGVA